MKKTECSFLTSPVSVKGNQAHLYLNAEGLGENANLRLELLDTQMKEIAGFSGKDAAVVKESGFQVPVVFRERKSIAGLPEKIRLRVTFEGKDRERIRFSAIYLR